MRALIIGDVHLADHPPSVRTDSYPQDILAKLQFAGKQAKNHGAEVIVYAGDIFHIKAPSRTSHALVQSVADVMTAPGLPVRIVPGNHDLSNDRLESIPKQPLGTLAKASDIELLVGQDPDFKWLFGIPYLADWAGGLPDWMDRWQQSEAQLMVTHAPIFPPGVEPPYEYITPHDWALMMDREATVYYGHIHEQHGTFYVETPSIPRVTFCNNGAISRGSLHEETLKRKPLITVWDRDEVFSPLTSIEVPCKPAHEVFRLADQEAVETQSDNLEAFLAAIGETRLTGLSLEEVRAKAQQMDLKPGTLQTIEECLEHASG